MDSSCFLESVFQLRSGDMKGWGWMGRDKSLANTCFAKHITCFIGRQLRYLRPVNELWHRTSGLVLVLNRIHCFMNQVFLVFVVSTGVMNLIGSSPKN